jgi:hypothetical protein
MRAYARLALILMAVSAGLGLAGCASTDELKDTVSALFATGKSLGEHQERHSDDLAEATQSISPEKPPSKASKKKDKPARQLQQQQTVEPQKKPAVSASADTLRRQGAEAESAPSATAPSRLRTPWPEAPASGTFAH